MVSRRHDYQSLYTHNTTGARGVSYDKTRDRWEVKVQKAGQRIRVGRYRTMEEATAAHTAFIQSGELGVFKGVDNYVSVPYNANADREGQPSDRS